ncbi:MAG TPA: hypothetical protein VK934_12445, partial [Fimbriimonas sp.]|nr:hypothetical protein [Fimbriimonas sp.]
ALAPGLSLMSSLVQAPLLKQEDFGGRPIPPDIWGSALRPHFYNRSNATREEVVKVYEQVFRPEHVTLAVGGPLKEGAVSEEWSKRVAAWQPPRMRRYIEDLSPKAFAFSQNATVEAIDFSSAAPPNLLPRLLALFALGSGKGSSLFRVVRQQLGLSYRSEAVLSPTETGFNTRLVILAEPGASSERIREALLKDINTWKEPERVRALGMAQAVIERENGFSPFYLSGLEPIVSDFEGRVFMAGYWHMKTGLAWNPALILANLNDIPLTELQEAAKEIVRAPDPRA